MLSGGRLTPPGGKRRCPTCGSPALSRRCAFSMRFIRGRTCALTCGAANPAAITNKIGAMNSFFIIANLGLRITHSLRPRRQRESLNYSSTDRGPGVRGRGPVKRINRRSAERVGHSTFHRFAFSLFDSETGPRPLTPGPRSVISRHGEHALKGTARAFHHVPPAGDFEFVFPQRPLGLR